MPSSKYTELSLGEHASPYTAPANGYFCLTGYHIGGTLNNIMTVSNQTANIGSSTVPPTASASVAQLTVEANKGNIIRIYNYNGTFSSLKFVYALGEI